MASGSGTEPSQKVVDTLNLSPEDITALTDALGLSADSAKGFFLNLTSAEWAYAPGVQEAVKYLGFDAKKIISQFFKKAAEKPRSADAKPELKVGSALLYAECDAPTDLVFLITLFLERGNNMAKALLRCEPGIADVINRKCNAYGIITEKRQNASILGTSHLTLARIAQAFSPATASIIIAHSIGGKLKSRVFSGTLPLIMQHTIFAGLIPVHSDYTEELRSVACILNAETSILLATPKEKRKLMSKSFEDVIEEAQTFVAAAMNGASRRGHQMWGLYGRNK